MSFFELRNKLRKKEGEYVKYFRRVQDEQRSLKDNRTLHSLNVAKKNKCNIACQHDPNINLRKMPLRMKQLHLNNC